jgi:DUF4097 and DUF4098 domain-containing protein YvlB
MHKTFETRGPVRVDVSLPAGDIEIVEAGQGIEVELVARDPDLQELVDNARIELRGDELVVDVPERKGWKFSFGGGRGIHCRIACPDGSSLKARAKSADIEVTITLAEADIATASGDVSVRNVTGNLSTKTASGDIDAGDVGGRVSANSASGDISVRSAGGDLHANTASGDMSFESADRDVRANSASGDISVEAVRRGDVAINSASGDVHVGIRRGSRAYLDCSTVSGDTHSELDLSDEPASAGPMVNVKARTVSGDIRITRASAPADNAQEVQA